nr:elongation factor 1-delta [Tanacetum cinerariifolium]
MASLTPGVLSKLLQNINNPNAKIAGDHRTPLLQVIGIVPKDDVFALKKNGFYLRVSDSVHSAYVSVAECDVELVLSDKIQLGQFVYVTRLVSGSPVPVLSGVRVVAKRRACVGEPKDLISSEVLVVKGTNGNGVSFGKRSEGNGNASGRRLSLDGRRLSLDYSVRKGWDRSPVFEKHRSSGSDIIRDVEPTRSPLCSTLVRSVKKASSVKDFVLKPPNLKHLRSASDNIKVVEPSPPLCSTPVRSVKKASSVKDFVLKPPNVKHLRSGSDATKVVEPSSPLCSTPVRSVKKASSVKDFVLNPPNLNLAPLRNKNVIVSENQIRKPIKKDLKTSFDSIPVPGHLTQVSISARTWSDSNNSRDSVSPTIRELGKEAICRRTHGFSSAVHALEETSAMENILQCMSVFAEICELAESSKMPLVEQFLNFYQKLETSAAVVNTLIDSKSTVDKTKVHPSNSALWVEAALGTNLAKFTLLMMEEKTNVQHSEGNYRVVLEKASEKVQMENRLPENKRSPKTQESVTPRVQRAVPAPKKESPKRVEWSKGSGLKDTANLAEKLLLTSRKWFFNYLEVSLNKGFGLTKEEDSGVAVSLLGQLKRVNKWLDDSVRGDEKVENLRKKLYRFLLDHVQKAAR